MFGLVLKSFYDLICSLDGYKPLKREVDVDEDSPCLDVIMFE